MRTIEDVITALNMCTTGVDCRECPYFGDDCENLTRLRSDAVRYLYMYQGALRAVDAVDKLRKECKAARDKHIAALKEMEIGLLNEPLSWDELFSLDMVGKPVWSAAKRSWMLIIDSALDNRSWVDLVDSSGKQVRIEPHGLKQYQLYRREKK